MKKILFALAAIFTLGVSNVSADNDKLIQKSELPVQAQQFINDHFAQRNGFIPNLSILDLLFNMGPEGLITLRDSL